jgi:hypothetical protein
LLDFEHLDFATAYYTSNSKVRHGVALTLALVAILSLAGRSLRQNHRNTVIQPKNLFDPSGLCD